MTLEGDINITNEHYKDQGIALVYKKPTPIRVVQVEYPKNKIREAYFNEPSTLDYNGVYHGNYIEFDAKETQCKTSFPLSNIHSHQMEHVKKVLQHGGIAFLIIRFVTIDRTYLLPGEDLVAFTEQYSRKSIPLGYFENNAYLLELKYAPRLDYIRIVDRILKDKGSEFSHEKKDS